MAQRKDQRSPCRAAVSRLRVLPRHPETPHPKPYMCARRTWRPAGRPRMTATLRQAPCALSWPRSVRSTARPRPAGPAWRRAWPRRSTLCVLQVGAAACVQGSELSVQRPTSAAADSCPAHKGLHTLCAVQGLCRDQRHTIARSSPGQPARRDGSLACGHCLQSVSKADTHALAEGAAAVAAATAARDLAASQAHAQQLQEQLGASQGHLDSVRQVTMHEHAFQSPEMLSVLSTSAPDAWIWGELAR